MSDNSSINVGFRTEKPFVPLWVETDDLVLGTIAFGWFFGFSFFVVVNAFRETKRTSRKFNAYIIMIWLEIIADIAFAVISWGYLYKKFPPGLAVFGGIIACWIVQVQCLMLIIANRTCLLYSDPKARFRLKFATAAVVSVISISTAFIWIPAQLQINHRFIALNHWWDKFEKCVYLILDAVLNAIFIRTIKKRLVDHGLTKYDKVVRFNQRIIFLSIAMDVFLLCMTMLRNGFVYCQFHPITYIVKLQIEMTMSNLIVRVARSTGVNVYQDKTVAEVNPNAFQLTSVHVQTQVYTHHHEDETTAGSDPSTTKKIREDELTRTADLTTVRLQSSESSTYVGDMKLEV
ncbi:hypothetical protein K435DRAFT_756036 [Dendrothele bispora CBS 962.96]|uniref:Uncharacterized protein n=1 Tax=Dendrothele bispora (strain CBS 962.96) TaxID=1314807 RepID=A0A4S8M027_DENBC|nr:hypothetical protein K435DRAFT_756036 [Dendrothele bispora CBS 962.96]